MEHPLWPQEVNLFLGTMPCLSTLFHTSGIDPSLNADGNLVPPSWAQNLQVSPTLAQHLGSVMDSKDCCNLFRDPFLGLLTLTCKA